MLSVDEALERITAPFSPLPMEWVHLGAAHERVLAADLVAERDQPPRALSAMDGYAVRAADLASGEARLEVVGKVPAGGSFETKVGAGQAVRIFTGAPLPPGTDAVAIQENATVEDRFVRIEGAVEPGEYVRPAGLDFRAGEIGLPANRRLTARDVGFAAALNHAWLPVRRRPRIALLATGDELALPGRSLGPNRIVSSNTPALSAMVEVWGAQAVDLGIVPDQPEALAKVAGELRGVDLVVTTGGASVGEHDLVRGVLGKSGLELDFWRIAMRPGKPLLFGHIRGVPLLGLPGNPVSAGVCAVLFVRAVIHRLLDLDPAPPWMPAVLGRALGANDRREAFLRATARWRDDGRLEVDPAAQQDSSMFALFARADCLVRHPASAPAMPAGAPVTVLPLGSGPIGV